MAKEGSVHSAWDGETLGLENQKLECNDGHNHGGVPNITTCNMYVAVGTGDIMLALREDKGLDDGNHFAVLLNGSIDRQEINTIGSRLSSSAGIKHMLEALVVAPCRIDRSKRSAALMATPVASE